MKSLSVILLGLVLSACTTHPVIPTVGDIKISREKPDSDCEDLGFIEGRVSDSKGTTEQAVENLKEEAIKKGANYVKMETIGALGTSVRGQAYYCR
ncbi:MAG TPA: DUF4156 domain-containing protein [Pseudobdellovibrionaceae bacterium]|nr:DUF4156 domain-containing protein [Pseudobdellovibrionaceae bacterium]